MKLFPISRNDAQMRLDRWLKANFNKPQSFFQRMLRQKQIFLYDTKSQKKIKTTANVMLSEDHSLQIGMVQSLYHSLSNHSGTELPQIQEKLPAELELDTLYEDDELIAFEKPPHLATQLGTDTNDSVATRYPHLKLVHRLDKETSGVLLLAKTRRSAADLASLFRDNHICKTYMALVEGIPLKTSGVIDNRIDMQHAITRYKVLSQPTTTANTTWLELQPKTGRKHQLRRHCLECLQTPIVGDIRYGSLHSRILYGRMMLHAAKIEFFHPVTKKHIQIISTGLHDMTQRASASPPPSS